MLLLFLCYIDQGRIRKIGGGWTRICELLEDKLGYDIGAQEIENPRELRMREN